MKTKNVIMSTVIALGLLLHFNANAQLNLGGVKVPKMGAKKSNTSETNTNEESSTSNENNQQKKKYTEEEVNKILTMTNYPNYNADYNYVYTNYNMLKNITNLQYDTVGLKTVMDSLTIINKRLEVIKATYSEYWAVYYDYKKTPEDQLYHYYYYINKVVKAHQTTIDDLVAKAPNYIQSYSNGADQLYMQCNASHSVKDENGQNRYYQFKSQYASAANYMIVLAKSKGMNDPVVTENLTKYNAATKKVKEIIINVEREELAKELAPVEKYKGADKEKHRAEIIKTYNESTSWSNCRSGKIIKVYFLEEQWNKKTGIDWDNGGKNYDNSFLNVALVVADNDNPEKANVLYSYVVKDNINGGKLDYSYCSCGANKQYSMLVKNISGKIE